MLRAKTEKLMQYTVYAKKLWKNRAQIKKGFGRRMNRKEEKGGKECEKSNYSSVL